VSVTEITALVPEDTRTKAEQIKNKCIEFKNTIVAPIKSNEQAEVVALRLRELSTAKREIEAHRKATKDPHIKAGNEIDKYFNEIKASIEGLWGKYEQESRAWQRHLAEIERKKNEEAQRKADEERRRKDEAARKEREKAEAYAAQGRADMAQRALERAEEKQEAAASVVAATVVIEKPKTAGVFIKKNWTAMITDAPEFVKYCVANNLPEFLIPNESALRNEAKKTQQAKDFPGARIYCEETTVSKSL
jgi:hypothetical protein